MCAGRLDNHRYHQTKFVYFCPCISLRFVVVIVTYLLLRTGIVIILGQKLIRVRSLPINNFDFSWTSLMACPKTELKSDSSTHLLAAEYSDILISGLNVRMFIALEG